MKTAISEKQWTAIIAVGWVLVFVHASMAQQPHEGAGVRYLQTLHSIAPNAGADFQSRI